MRLIDADKIPFHIFHDMSGYDHKEYEWDIIDKQPTVEAIPIELYEQVIGERDVAVEQLKVLNIELFEKPYLKAIPIEWLQKKIVDYVLSRKFSSADLTIVHALIRDWENDNQRTN